jgi:ABC-2 type transport system ATP-binding protein
MPDLLDPADSGRGDRQVSSELGARNSEHRTGAARDPVPSSALRVPSSELAEAVLRCQRVSKWYGPVIGVNQVSLELRRGITGLVGANGAGKSTLMRLITGQLRPDLGHVEVGGLPAWSAAAKRHVGYCPDADSFYEEMSGRQFVECMARLCGWSAAESRRRSEAVLELVGMTTDAHRCVRGYSKGMRQRIKLAQALLHDPELLILDEPLSGIDPVGRAEFLALFHKLAGQGKTLLVSSHELDELEKLTDHVAIMARGRIAAVGTIAQIRDRLAHHPLTIRIALEPTTPPSANGDGKSADAEKRRREVAAAILRLPDVVGLDLAEPEMAGAAAPVEFLVRARNPQRFFRDFTRLVLEEWYEVRHLQTLDDSTEAVLGYLLGGGQ